jgi:hypothetical protein
MVVGYLPLLTPFPCVHYQEQQLLQVWASKVAGSSRRQKGEVLLLLLLVVVVLEVLRYVACPPAWA